MSSQPVKRFREEYLHDVRSIARFISALLVVAFVVVFIALVELVAINPFVDKVLQIAALGALALGLILLNRRSRFPAELFRRLHLDSLVPFIATMLEDHERLKANEAVAAGMEKALQHYAVWPDLCLARDAYLDTIVGMMPLVGKNEERIAACAAASSARRCPEAGHLSAGLLELLYRERNGEPVAPYEESEENRLSTELEIALRRSGRLQPELVCSDPYQADDPPFCYQGSLAELVRPLHRYHLDDLRDRLERKREANREVVLQVRDTLNVFDAFDLREEETARLANSLPAGDDRECYLANCANNIGQHLEAHNGRRPPAPEVVEVLVRGNSNFHLHAYWRQSIPLLAPVLLNSPPLKALSGPRLTPERLEAVLGKLKTFSLEATIEAVSDYQDSARAADQMVELLDRYQLLGYLLPTKNGQPGVFGSRTALREDLTDLLAARKENGQERIKRCAEAGEQYFAGTSRPLPAALLDLLYRERYSSERLLAAPTLVDPLARVLVGSGLLPPPSAPLRPYTAGQIGALLNEMAVKQQPFTLSGVVDAVSLFDTRRRRHLTVVLGLERVLNTYGLFKALKPEVRAKSGQGRHRFKEASKWRLVDDLPDDDDDLALVAHGAASVAVDREDPSEPPSAELLELLYRERHELPLDAYWRQVRDVEAAPLAAVLCRDGLLPPPDPERFPYRPAHVATLLGALETYSLNLVQRDLSGLEQLWQLVDAYQDFLASNEVSGWAIGLDGMVDYLRQRPLTLPNGPGTLDAFEPATLDLLVWVGEQAMTAAQGGLQPAEVKSFCLISLAMFLTRFERNVPELRRTVCQRAAALDEAVEIALAYVDFRADQGGSRRVSIRFLIDHWQARIAAKRDALAGIDDELATIRETLALGQWFTRLWHMLEEMLRKIRANNQLLDDHVRASRAAEEALRGVFTRKVKVPTLERFLEARTVSAYLISFDSTSGSMAKLIDCLSLRYWPGQYDFLDGALTVSQQREIAQYDMMQQLGIAAELWDPDGGQWIYNFVPYTSHSRIGIVPNGWELDAFQQRLEGHLKILANETTLDQKQVLAPTFNWTADLDSTQVIVHPFGLRNHFAIELTSQSEAAVQNMKFLVAGRMDGSELVATTVYELRDSMAVAAEMMQGTIIQLTADAFEYADDKEKRALISHDEAIRGQLLQESGLASLRDLGRQLVAQPQRITATIALLANLLQVEIQPLQNDAPRAAAIAQAYVETLVGLGQLFQQAEAAAS